MIKCNLKILMAKYNTTRKELSEKTDIGLNSIGRYINNDWVKFDKEHMDALCKFFDCDISELITFENENKKNEDELITSLFSAPYGIADKISANHNYFLLSNDEHEEVHIDDEYCEKRNTSTEEIFKKTLIDLLNSSIYRNKK